MIDRILEVFDEDDSFDVLEYFEFSDDVEAHNENLQKKQSLHFEELLTKNSMLISDRIGISSFENNDLEYPVCGIWKSSIWNVDGKDKYLAIAQEDRECPILFIAGVL